jgi:hypothetical protein
MIFRVRSEMAMKCHLTTDGLTPGWITSPLASAGRVRRHIGGAQHGFRVEANRTQYVRCHGFRKWLSTQSAGGRGRQLVVISEHSRRSGSEPSYYGLGGERPNVIHRHIAVKEPG